MEQHQRKRWNRNSTALLSMMAVTVLGLVTGCTDTTSPVPTTEASKPPPSSAPAATGPAPSPTPTAKPSPTPIPASSKGPAQNWPVPKAREGAKDFTAQGLANFAEFYFELLDYGIQTNDNKPLIRYTDRSCSFCGDNFIDPITLNKKSGAWTYGARLSFQPSVARLKGKDGGLMQFSYLQSKATLFNSDGSVHAELPAFDKAKVGSLLARYDGRWKVVEFETADQQ